ncbi:MAG: pyrroline-5-carboxylate reductase [Saprospiraceae bacterium]|nr:pyrroline-5-carboxylate reductase [Saprospiraceae bacterium]MBK8668071.1 pyrroline-5-carboxylate reductase [Saprospiraceae bacterium]
MKIAIIGCGNMGMAFARSFIQYELVKKENLLLIEKNEERCQSLKSSREGVVVNTINEKIAETDLVILAVKPQDFEVLSAELKGKLKEQQVVLSIMAGIPILKIQTLLHHKSVVRAMPNTPAMLGMGITGFTSAEGISIAKLFKVENLINATGRSIYIEDESMIDAVTALSGSGPAYFYYFVKHMVEAGKKMGFDEGTSLLLVKQTMQGAYHLINNAELDLDALIKAVASKGGTTEAAIKVFNENGMDSAIVKGVLAAEKRAKELSR